MSGQTSQTFTGRRRRRSTKRSVIFADRASRALITVGGVGTIVAVSLVFVTLFYDVVPLFQSAEISEVEVARAPWSSAADQRRVPVKVQVDEYNIIAWALFSDGSLEVFRPDTGQLLQRRELFPDQKLTAHRFTLGADDAAFGFEDGSLRLAEIAFETTFLDEDAAPEEIARLGQGEAAAYAGGVVERISPGQFRRQQFELTLHESIEVADSPVRLVDHVFEGTDLGVKSAKVATYSDDGKLAVHKFDAKKNLFTGKVTFRKASSHPVEVEPREQAPTRLLLSGRGDKLHLAWEDGLLRRFDSRHLDDVKVAEEFDLAPGDATLTALDFLLGRRTLVAGDSAGCVRAVFTARTEHAVTSDLSTLVLAHTLPPRDAAVTALGMSSRSRMAAIGYADGVARVFYLTNENQVAEFVLPGGEPIQSLAIAPKLDALYATTTEQFLRAKFDPMHPEISLASVFTPVWYEGYAEARHVWQSSAGTVDAEMKLGLWPLIFGTLKATFYSMLFGAPLALLAAVYTSEYLHPRLKAKIKPTVEVMASLPSVVLGFLAALVFAPFIEKLLPGALACFVTVPLTLLLGAHLWLMLPQRAALRWAPWRFGLMCLCIPLGVAFGLLLGPTVEGLLFAGSIMHWLDGQRGSGVGGWMLLFFPLAAMLTALLFARYVNPWLKRWGQDWDRDRYAVANFGKFAVGILCAVLLTWFVSGVLSFAGFDPRGSFVDTYVQRNALVVGFVMGFAIIPIIYTIAEDALSTVPDHLRSASLGAGATPWQTVVRIVIPTAMSGLFSALMIGLGRAVGETMIVLMAAGNTPVMDWNIFNGFRTLSANIAVELPEAVKDSTHYRTLVLGALVLFLMTFVVNTVAEMVRLRFRKRAYQL